MNSRVRTYVLATSLAAIVAGIALFIHEPSVDVVFVQAIVALGAVGLLAQLLGFQHVRTVAGSVSFIPFLAMAAVAPHWLTLACMFAITAGVQYFRQYDWIKKTFNIAQQSLSYSVAMLAYIEFGGRSMLVAGPTQYIPLIVLFFTYSIVNGVCVTGVVSVSEGRKWSEVWVATSLQTLPYDLLSWPAIICLGWVYAHFHTAGALAFSVPLLGLRQLYKVNAELEKTNQELLELMVAAIEARDPYTSGHSRRVSEHATVIAQILGLRATAVKRVQIAALLHDVGKIHEVFAPILQKPGRLTDEENAIMQTHPIKSEELVSKVSQLRDIVPAVRNHHENWDGTGYPDGLAGERIPLASRIIMFADTIDAMTSDRPYRKALDADAVRAELIKYRGRQFDPSICDALLSSGRYEALFKYSSHQSLLHTQEVPRLRLAVNP